MKKILLFLIAGALFLPREGMCREGNCEDSKIVYLSAFEVDPNLLLILDNSESMNIIAQPTVENGYTCTTGAELNYIYNQSKPYTGPFSKQLQVNKTNGGDGWRVIGERGAGSGKWVCAYFVENDYSGGLGGTYEANYLNWLLNYAHLEGVTIEKPEGTPFADYGTDKFYRVELKRVNTRYIKGIPRFVSDLTDEEGTPFLESRVEQEKIWLKDYLSDDTIQGVPWYNYWYNKPASRMNVARYALCELLRTDLKKINAAWEFKFCYGLMTFRNYYDKDQYIYDKGVWVAATNSTSQWVARGGELLVENGTLTKAHLDEIQGHITTIEARWLTQLGETIYEAGAYYMGTDTYFCVASGGPPPTQHKIIKGPATYNNISPIKWWCQDSNILLVTDGYPTHDTEVPPLLKMDVLLHQKHENAIYGIDFSDTDFDYDYRGDYNWKKKGLSSPDYLPDGKEPPPYQERNPVISGIKWNEEGSATGCSVLMGGTDDLWCSHYLDDVIEYYYRTDAVNWDPYNYHQPINTYIVGFGYDSPFLKEAAEDAIPGSGTYNPNNYLGLSQSQQRYFTATSKKKLVEGLMNIIEDIISRMSSSVSVAVSLSTSQSQSDDRLVRAKFDPSGWKGYLEAFTIPYCDTNKKDDPDYWEGAVCVQKPEWEAGKCLGTETRSEYDHPVSDSKWRNLGGIEGEGKRMMYTYLGGLDRTGFDVSAIGAGSLLYNALKGTSTLEEFPVEKAKALACWTRGEYWVDSTDTTTGFNPGTSKFLPDVYSNWLWSRDQGWRLFEIIYSSPLVVGAPNAWYGTDSYTDNTTGFAKQFQNRERVTYVGDNGGSLHCFKLMDDKGAKKDGSENWKLGGWEKWAYIPSNLLRWLQYRAEKNYCRFSMVDLGVVTYDVLFSNSSGKDYFDDGLSKNNNWRTVLIGGERAGGAQWFCLNVTQPDCMTNLGSKTVLWEYSDRERLGDSYSYPEGGRIEDEKGGHWLAFLTTGPQQQPETDTAYIIALDMATVTTQNTPYNIIPVKDSSTGEYGLPPLTSCSALDLKEQGGRFDSVMDVLYFGDMAGNLWKMKVGSSADSWKPRIFFKATDPLGQSQPIAVSISIAFNKGYEPCLFFGSGRYLTKADSVSTQTQTFYSLIDKDGGNLPSNILKRTDLNAIGFADVGQPPSCSGETFNPSGTRSTYPKLTISDPSGWFLDFTHLVEGSWIPYKGCDNQTERAPEPALVYGGIVFFTSIIPDTAPCEAGGYGYLNAMNYLTGTIDEEIIVGAGIGITSVCLGKGAPSRPIIDTENSQILTQMSTGEILVSPVKRLRKSVEIVNWGEEGIIRCHVCENNITHRNWVE